MPPVGTQHQWKARLSALESLTGLKLGFFDFSGRLRTLIGMAHIHHDLPACRLAKSKEMDRCKAFESRAHLALRRGEGEVWKTCRHGVVEVMLPIRTPFGLDGALFAGSFSGVKYPMHVEEGREPATSIRGGTADPRVPFLSSHLPLLETLARGIEADLAATPDFEKDRRVDKATLFLSRHYADPGVSAEKLAADLALSPSGLRSWLKKNFGRGFLELVQERRLEAAKTHLLHSDASLDRIAPLCGWENARGLDKAFRRAEGLSPGGWRRKMLSKVG